MKNAMDAAVAELPDPVSSAHIKSIAETILRTAKDGETDPAILQRMAPFGASNYAARLTVGEAGQWSKLPCRDGAQSFANFVANRCRLFSS
jgi:hypothetical protein